MSVPASGCVEVTGALHPCYETARRSGIAAPADIGFDRAEGKVAVPQLTENTMELLDVGSVLGQ